MSSHTFQEIIAPLMLVPVVALIIAAYYPGHISYDSLWLLEQARTNNYVDMHPPILAWLWRPLDQIWPGPISILIINQVCLTTGIYLVLRSFHRPIVAMIITAIIAFAPPILGISGMVVKDAVLLSAFVLAVGLMVRVETTILGPRAKLALFALAVPLLLLAHVARLNSFPLTMFAGYALLRLIVARLRPAPLRHRFIVHLALLIMVFTVCVAIEASIRVFNTYFLVAKKSFAYRVVMIYDLVGMSIDNGVVLLDQTYFPSQRLSDLQENFDWDIADSVIAHGIEPNKIQDSTDPRNVRALTRQWLNAIRDLPGSYLRVRLVLFSRLLGIGGGVCSPYLGQIDSNDPSITVRYKDMNTLLISFLEYCQHMPINRPWIYLILITPATIILFRRNNQGTRTLSIIGIGAIIYVIAYFFIAPSCEYRYVAPLVIVALLQIFSLMRFNSIRARIWSLQEAGLS